MQVLFRLTQEQTKRASAIVDRVLAEDWKFSPDKENFSAGTSPHYAGNLLGWMDYEVGIYRWLNLSCWAKDARMGFTGKRSSLRNTKALAVLKEIASGDLDSLCVQVYSSDDKHLKWYE